MTKNFLYPSNSKISGKEPSLVLGPSLYQSFTVIAYSTSIFQLLSWHQRDLSFEETWVTRPRSNYQFFDEKKRRRSHGFLHCVKPSLVARKRLNVLPSFLSLQVVIFKCQFSNSEKLELQKLRATKSTLLRNTLKKTSIYFDRAHN